jgi:2-polyprenyl-3-methyl-5-hydroxy-6-metoxy-1,4-benzoquinol methylase
LERKQDIKLKELHKKLNRHVEEQNDKWESFVYAKQKKFYQGLDEIEIDGCRSSEIRYERYAIDRYLSKEKTALDIGCNCGFFTIYVSKMLKCIEGVEINPYLIKIAKDTKDFLEKNHVEFFATSFEKFKTEKKYDIIFSLANDETIDGNTKFTFKEYIEKICKLMKSDGYLIFETVSTDTYAPKLFNPKLKHLTNLFEILEDKMVKSEYPLNVPERRFLVMKLKK